MAQPAVFAVKGEARGALYKARSNRESALWFSTSGGTSLLCFAGSQQFQKTRALLFFIFICSWYTHKGLNLALASFSLPRTCSSPAVAPCCREPNLLRRTLRSHPPTTVLVVGSHSDFHALFLFSNVALIQLFCTRSICLSANTF